MRIISLIDDQQLGKKVLKSAIGGSNTNRLRERMWYIRLRRSPRIETFIIYDESSSPGADDYIIDADRSTLSFDPEALDGRLSTTGYPIETYL